MLWPAVRFVIYGFCVCLCDRGIRLPLFRSSLIAERMAAVAELVVEGGYDLVVFQEVSVLIKRLVFMEGLLQYDKGDCYKGSIMT